MASGAPPNCPLRLRETPYTTPSGLSPAISENTASQLPSKGGYPQLQGRGYHSSPRSSGDISISHLGVSRGHRNVPHTSHCLYKATPDSSGLRRPPSRTLLLYNGSFLQDPLSLQPIQLFTARLSFLQKSVHPNVSDPNNKHLNSDKSRNHINLRNTHIYEHYNKAALSHNINTSCFFKKTRGTPRLTCHRKRPPPVKAAISNDDTRDR